MDNGKSSGGRAWNSHPLSGFDGGDAPSAEEEIEELARLIYAEAGGGRCKNQGNGRLVGAQQAE